MADVFLRDNFRNLYTEFDEFARSVEQFRKDFGGENSLVEGMLGKLDEDHFAALMDLIALHPSVIKDWETLGNAIHYISEQDLSNVSNIANTDVGEIQAAAADKYNIYQSLEDQVAGGKTISKKELESLEPEVQEMFSMMANGSYKMTEDAQKFYDTVNNLKLDGFFQTLESAQNEIDKLQALSDRGFDYDKLNQSAVKSELYGVIDYDLVQQQLEYLDAVSTGNAELETAIDLWQQQIDKQALSKEAVEEIAEAVADARDQTSNLTDRIQEFEDLQKEVEEQLYDALFPTDEDIDLGTLESLSETLQDIADQSDELADTLSDDARAAEDVAEAILRFDDAIEDVVDNYDDWMDALNNGSLQEQAEIIDDLRDAYADLLDMDGSSLSNDFLTNTENLDLMKAAIDGDIEAYDELMMRAQQDIIAGIKWDEAQYQAFINELNLVQGMLDDMNYQKLEIGADLDTGDFLQACTDLVNAAGMTAQQATDYLASMGVDAEVIETKTEGTESKQQTGWTSNLQGHTEYG